MSEKKSGKPARRRIQVGGQEVDRDSTTKEQSFVEAFKLDKSPPAEPESAGGRTYSEAHLAKFLTGKMTLGDLEGITKQQQYQIADIGFAYLTSAKLPEAKKVFEGLIALDPYDAYFHTALGSIAQQQNDAEEAEKRYTRALEINPFSPTAYANRGEVRVMVGRLAEGAADLVKAIELDPDGKEPATVRAKATVRVLNEQLGSVDLNELEERARAATNSKVKAVQEATRPRPQPRARPRPKAAARRPGSKKK